MKVAIRFQRKSDSHEFVREYEPEDVGQAVRFIEKYTPTCEVVSLHMDEEMRIAVENDRKEIERVNAEISGALKEVWELMTSVLAGNGIP